MQKKTSKNIKFEYYNDEYLENIAQLRDLYAESYVNSGSEMYNWKLNTHPFRKPMMVVAKDRNNIVAMLSVSPKKLQLGEREIDIADLQDGFTHPEYQRLGLFSKLLSILQERLHQQNIHVIYGIANTKSYLALKKNGWIESMILTSHYRPINTKNIIKYFIKNRFISLLANIFARPIVAAFNVITLLKNDHSIRIEQHNKIPNDCSNFIQKANTEYYILLKRNINFLDWRFAASPEKYKIYSVNKEENIVGYFVLKISKYRGLKRGSIADFFALKDKNLNISIIKSIIQIFKNLNVDFVYTLTNKDSFLCKMCHSSFLPINRKKYFLIYNNGLDDAVFKELQNGSLWYFTIGDTDNI